MKDSTTKSRIVFAAVKPAARKILCLLLWLGIWWVAALLIQEEILLPAPDAVLRTLVSLVGESFFWKAVGSSLLHVGMGFLLALAVGTVLGVLTHVSHFAYDFFYPALSVVKATPVASFIILALFWLPTQRLPVLISFLMVLPVVWTNVHMGLEQVDGPLREMGRAYHFTASQRLRYLYFPTVIPFLQAACLAGLGMAWKAGVASEVIGRVGTSIGTYLVEAKLYLNMPDLFAWTVVTVCISVSLEKILAYVLKRFARRWGYGRS